MEIKMEKDETCNGCAHIRSCPRPYKACLCKTCLVKSMCQRFCYARHVSRCSYLKTKPITEGEFIKVQHNNRIGGGIFFVPR